MIKGEIKRDQITKESIFRLITPFDIYQYYVGRFRPNDVMCNPFRDDNTPSFIIGNKIGQWTHFDFADEYWRGDAISLVMQIFGTNFDGALKQIDRDFKLGLGDGKTLGKSVITWEPPKEEEIVPPPFFQVITKNWTAEELRWWNMYHQDKADLLRENIYSPYKIYRNRRLLPLIDSLLTFCYFEPITETWKLYRPDGSNGKDVPIYKRKWDSSIAHDVVEGLEDINGCEIAIIEKARKDKMVLKKALGTNCICNVQAEDPYCLNAASLLHIKENSKLQIVTSDNDKKGKQFSWWLTNEHGYKHCNVPHNIPNKVKQGQDCKDFAEWGRDYGLDVIRKHFQNKELI